MNDQKQAIPLTGEQELAGLPVEIFVCDLDESADARRIAQLSREERERADRFHFERDGRRFARGRIFLRETLGRRLGVSPGRLEFTSGRNGKPGLRGGPEFNLSHSGDVAVLAVSQSGPVGVDVERTDQDLDLHGLIDGCFVEEERWTLSGLSGGALNERFFAFWTAKEALMKYTGQGLSLEPKSILLKIGDGWPIGYIYPRAIQAVPLFADVSRQDVICCITVPQNRSLRLRA